MKVCTALPPLAAAGDFQHGIASAPSRENEHSSGVKSVVVPDRPGRSAAPCVEPNDSDAAHVGLGRVGDVAAPAARTAAAKIQDKLTVNSVRQNREDNNCWFLSTLASAVASGDITMRSAVFADYDANMSYSSGGTNSQPVNFLIEKFAAITPHGGRVERAFAMLLGRPARRISLRGNAGDVYRVLRRAGRRPMVLTFGVASTDRTTRLPVEAHSVAVLNFDAGNQRILIFDQATGQRSFMSTSDSTGWGQFTSLVY